MPRRRQSDPVASRFGAIIRRHRLDRGFTLAVAARRAGISVSYLGFLERGENVPTLSVVLELAAVFSLDPGDLVREVARRPEARRSVE